MPEQRRAVRFDLRLPVEFVQDATSHPGETKNVSSRGILLATEKPVLLGQSLEYFLMLPSRASENEVVRVRCRGHVLRLEGAGSGTAESATTLAAVTLERYEFQRRPA
jgi:hypothetical protein